MIRSGIERGVLAALLVLTTTAAVSAQGKMDAKVKLPQRLISATELLREVHAQTGVKYAYPSGALVRQIDATPFGGEATVKNAVARLAPKVSVQGEVVVLEADLPEARLKELADRLASDKPDDRRLAAYELGNTRSAAPAKALFDALAREKDESVRHHLLRSLDRLEHDLISCQPFGRVSVFPLAYDGPAEALVEVLKSAPEVSHEWVWSAGLVGRLARPANAKAELERGARNGYIRTQQAAQWAMARLEPPARSRAAPASRPTAADLLAKLLAEKDAEPRAELLLALGRAGGKEAWDALLAHLADKDAVIRQAAIRALDRCPDERAVGTLVAILTGEKGDAEDRNLAAMSLGMIASPAVVEKLTDYVRKSDKPISTVALALSWCADGGNAAPEAALIECINKKDTDEHGQTHCVLRSYAYIGLARIGSPAAVAAISGKYNEYDNTARYVGHSAIRLAGAWTQSAVDHYVATIRAGRGKIAPHGLEGACDPRAVDALVEQLPASKGERLHWVVQALGRIGDPKAVPALLSLLDHPERWVGYEAVRALRWRWYWSRPDVQAALNKHPVFKAFVAPPPALADQPENTWVLRHWPIDFDDYRAVNTTYEAGMTFDESTGRVVKSNSHGQRCDAPQLGETWLYDPAANAWQQSNAPVIPFGMCGTWGITYDRANRKVVFIEAEGGHHGWQWDRGRALRGSVPWVYDGSRDGWTPMNPLHVQIGPGLRAFGPLVFLDSRQQVFLHGSAWGGNVSKELAGRSWTYDVYSNIWTMLPQPEGPTPGNRSHHAMCYLADRDQVLLAPGGSSRTTWLYDVRTNRWTDAQAKGSPPSFRLPMVYDPVSRTALVFIAESGGTHIWQYDPSANEWRKVDSPVPLSPHHDSVDAVYDPGNNVFIMDGGHVNWNTDHIGVRELWTYRFKKAPAKAAPARAEPAVSRPQPPYPADVVVSVKGDGTVHVRWAKPAGPAEILGYHVHCAPVEAGGRMHHREVFKKVGPFERLTAEPVKAAEFADARKLAEATGLFNHEMRAYYVTAVGVNGVESGPSATVLTLASSVPRATAVEQPDGSTLIKWDASPEKDLRGYAVYRMDEWRGSLAVRLNPVPVKATQFVDWCESPRAERRRYYVVAVDGLNQEGVPSTGAWAFGRP